MGWVNGNDIISLFLALPPTIIHSSLGSSALPLWPLLETAQGTTLSCPAGLWLLRSALGESPLTTHLK